MPRNQKTTNKLKLLGAGIIASVILVVGLSISYAMMYGYFPWANLNPLVSDASSQTGTVQVVHYDNFSGQTTKKECIVKIDRGGKIPYPGKCDHSLSGARVRVNGSNVQILARAAHKTKVTGNKRVLVIPFNFNFNQTQPFTKAEMQAVFTNGPDAVNNFYKTSSYNQTGVEATVLDWKTVTVPNTGSCDDAYYGSEIARINAPTGFDYYMFVFPVIPECPYGGWAFLDGNTSFINGSSEKSLWTHELGHNFGAMHASLLKCGSNQINIYSCPIEEYGDPWDVMGHRSRRMSNYHVLQLGWMTSASTKTITKNNSSGSHTLTAIEQTTGIRDLIIPLNDGSNYSYHLEYRCCEEGTRGVIVRLGYNDLADRRNTMLIGTHDGGTVIEGLLFSGQTYHDRIHGIKITVENISNTAATLKIKLGEEKASVDIKIGLVYQSFIEYKDDLLVVPLGREVSLKWGSVFVKPGSCKIKPTNITGDSGTYGLSATTNTTYTLTCQSKDGVEVSDNVKLKIGNCVQTKPTFLINPTDKSGVAGATLNYKLTVKNNDSLDCSNSTFNINSILPPQEQQLTQTPREILGIKLKPGETFTKNIKIKSDLQSIPGPYTFINSLNSSNGLPLNSVSAIYRVQ